MPIEKEKKKRGRKPKKKTESTEPKIPKKRGRKPRGGKIVTKSTDINKKLNTVEANIILHLKCNTTELDKKNFSMLNNKYNPKITQPTSFSLNSNQKLNSLTFENINDNDNNMNLNVLSNFQNSITNPIIKNTSSKKETVTTNDDDVDIKDIWKKLSNLKYQLHYNCLPDKRSSCFWCTCPFDNPAIYIPSKIRKGVYDVYGCFCSPECSVAHLMNEKIDSSIKFERYQLLNHIYGKIYNYSKNIKPAPDPHYILDKFYGTLSIKEYRDLFKTDQLLIVVDKPLTHVFPELYEDNSDFILNQRTIPSNSTFKLKRKGANTKKTSVHDSLTTNQV